MAPAINTPIMCIGQPGRDDLESLSARKTKYNLIKVSVGSFHGMLMRGCDPHDNSTIGTLKHDAWTYWGHSGVPLLQQSDGTLVGLHSSWDDVTLMRHGIPLLAIARFWDEANEKKLETNFGRRSVEVNEVREDEARDARTTRYKSRMKATTQEFENEQFTVLDRLADPKHSMIVIDDDD